VFQLDVIFLILAIALPLCAVLARAPSRFEDAARPVLICAAHSDDCVIMGAEYAYGVMQKGMLVKVVYLTCSGPHPEAGISRMRQSEAETAWSSRGVHNDNLIFFNLSESQVGGPLTYSNQEISRVTEDLTAIIKSLPPNAAVLIPADGESHVDHRTMRRISLRAVADAQREDLIVYETPEYNSFLSIMHSPKKTVRSVLRHIPFMNRVIAPFAGAASYVNGSPGSTFRDSPGRLSQKKEMLSYFTSQDVALLVRTFGYESRYRQGVLQVEQKPWCYPGFGGCCDVSAIAFSVLLLIAGFLTSYQIAVAVVAFSSAFLMKAALILSGGLTAIIYVYRLIQRTASPETTFFACAGALGLVSGALLS
jgi:LmbE family N-acetylglucosaminyl deacetylase